MEARQTINGTPVFEKEHYAIFSSDSASYQNNDGYSGEESRGDNIQRTANYSQLCSRYSKW